MSESVIRHFLEGRSESMSERTYAKLAWGASQLLNIPVHASQLRGDPDNSPPQVPIHAYVGAGDEVFEIKGDEPIEYSPGPVDSIDSAAAIVRTDSMSPVFERGDVLFWVNSWLALTVSTPGKPRGIPKRACIVRLTSGRIFVKKLLPGSEERLFHLLSLDPQTAPILNEPVESFARIAWVKPSNELVSS
jgi:phage repressor protein C with HTH and peptisase S24 domain